MSEMPPSLVWHRVRNHWYLIGPAFILASFFWMHYRLGLTRLAGSLAFPDLVCLFGCLIIFAYLLASRFVKLNEHRPRFMLIGLICGVASMLCIALPDAFGLSYCVFGIIGACLFACYLITFWLLWFAIFKQQGIMVAVIYVLLSTALGYCLAWFMLGIDAVRLIWALVAIALLSGGFLFVAVRRTHGKHPPADKALRPRLPLGFALVSLAFSASYMYTITINGIEIFHSAFNWDLLISSLVLLALVLLLRKQLTLAMLFSLAAPLMILGLLLTLFTTLDIAVLFSFFHLGFYIYLVFILILYCGFGKTEEVDGFRLACLLILSIFIGCFIGRLLYPAIELFLPGLIPDYVPVVSILIIGLLVVCTMSGLRDIYRLFGTVQASPRFEAFDTQASGALSAERIVEVYGLSERESEVLRLLLRGLTATQIAKEMVVAQGTAKAHIRNVYKKLDIHHRDELFALVSANFEESG